MKFKPHFRHTAALAAILCGTTASADVTAQQVWDNWKSQLDIYGEGFTVGAEEMSGDTLTVTDLVLSMSDPEASVNANLGTITLTENGDGTVSIALPESYPMALAFTPEYGDPSTINITVALEGSVLTASGDPEAINYDVTADTYTITVDSLEGEAAEEVDLQVATIALRDLSGRYTVQSGDLSEVDYDLSVGALDLDLAFTEKGGSGVVEGNADIADLTMRAQASIPEGMDMDADVPPFNEGLAFVGGYTFGELAYAFNFDADGEAASGSATATGGELGVSMDINGMSYTGETRDLDVSVLIPNEIPFPIEASLEKYGFDFQIPLSQGDDGPRDARLAFNITELVISETLWNIGDPQAILPREPLTVALGVDATVTPFFDFLDPEQMEAAAMSPVPGELNSAEITELVVRGAGAEITGEGAFTFDNTDLATFDGMPRPEGEMTFAINGVNGLVDKLIQMGLIPEEEAMMPRMMLGMFATPVGDDMLTSTIEVNAEGHVLANGQRLR